MLKNINSDMKIRTQLDKHLDTLANETSRLASLRGYPNVQLQLVGRDRLRITSFNYKTIECVEQTFDVERPASGAPFTALTPVYKALSANLDILFADWNPDANRPVNIESSHINNNAKPIGIKDISCTLSSGHEVIVQVPVMPERAIRDDQGNFVRTWSENNHGDEA